MTCTQSPLKFSPHELADTESGRRLLRLAGLKSAEHPAVRTRRVLLVEDQPDLNRSLKTRLERAGTQVVSVHDGAAALQAFLHGSPDILVLDLGLPDVDGWDVLLRLRGYPHGARLPVVIITGSSDEDLASAAAYLGVRCVVRKPFRQRQVVEAVLGLLDER